tara:strand:- start:792 stop:953 length:162 start_codon:yes stop_codon:yes gene_type:complete
MMLLLPAHCMGAIVYDAATDGDAIVWMALLDGEPVLVLDEDVIVCTWAAVGEA